jgi:protein SCO1/2
MRVWMALAAVTIAAAKSYSVDGLVVAVDRDTRTMLVAHRPIEGFMGAMTMPFRVESSGELEPLYPGARVQFELEVGKERSVARKVRKVGEGDGIPPAPQRIAIGSAVGDFDLTDQRGARVRLSDFRGKLVALNFIYTRCPLPDICPRLSANFAAVARKFKGSDLVLLSITVDPEYDTPFVLADYAKRWGADPAQWRFLTGAIGPVARDLGELYWTDEGSIGHNSVTSIISRDGRLAARVEGAAHRVDQLEHLIAHELEVRP